MSPIKNRQNIIWIASYPKSGNTWVRVFVHNLLRELRGETQGSQDINDLGRYAIWEHSYPHYTQILGKAPTHATAAEMATARPAAQALISRQQQGLSLTKTHLCFGTDHSAPTINLDVTLAAIYIVRNPLDVAISYAHHCSRSIDAIIADMAQPGFRTLPTEKHVGEILGSWSQNVASWMGVASRPVHIMRYEDMLAYPERFFGGLAAFLDLRPTEVQLRNAIEKSSFSELAKQELKHGFKEKPQRAERFFREGRAGQWRDLLSSEQIKKVLATHAPMMQRTGYLPQSAGSSMIAR
nr:sulfotransferase domain-containing protein [Agrobacterium vitis]